MSTDFVFAYGSNMNSSDLRSWLERNGFDSSLVVGRKLAILDGYDYVWNFYSSGRAGGAVNLEPKEKSSVCGVLIELDTSLLKAMDRKEGHPFFHARQRVKVRLLDQEGTETVLAWVYLAKPNKGDRRDIWPTRPYKKIVLDGAVEMGLPQECIEKIRAWQTEE